MLAGIHERVVCAYYAGLLGRCPVAEMCGDGLERAKRLVTCQVLRQGQGPANPK